MVNHNLNDEMNQLFQHLVKKRLNNELKEGEKDIQKAVAQQNGLLLPQSKGL